jgi:hypothetical protein
VLHSANLGEIEYVGITGYVLLGEGRDVPSSRLVAMLEPVYCRGANNGGMDMMLVERPVIAARPRDVLNKIPGKSIPLCQATNEEEVVG